MPPPSHPCPSCGKNFFASALRFHVPKCTAKMEMMMVPCPACGVRGGPDLPRGDPPQPGDVVGLGRQRLQPGDRLGCLVGMAVAPPLHASGDRAPPAERPVGGGRAGQVGGWRPAGLDHAWLVPTAVALTSRHRLRSVVGLGDERVPLAEEPSQGGAVKLDRRVAHRSHHRVASGWSGMRTRPSSSVTTASPRASAIAGSCSAVRHSRCRWWATRSSSMS